MLICTPVKRDAANNIGNTGTVIRYNVSIRDHNRLINLNGADDVTVEHNIFYIEPGEEVQALLVSQWDGWSVNALFRDNTFYMAGKAVFGHEVARGEDGKYKIGPGWGPARNIRFTGNYYIGPNAEPPGQNASVEKSASIPPLLDGEPSFDPARPTEFDAFMSAHRAWMFRMLAKALQHKVQLVN